MTAHARLPLATYESQFMARTRSLYNSMQQRFSEKRDKRDRVIRSGRPIPFTLDEFRARLLEHFHGEPSGSETCRYCGAWLTIGEIAVDHAIPVKRGGSLELSNLEFPCRPCNFRKGGLTPAEYLRLRDCLEDWPDAARTDVLSRLEKAVQLAASVRFNLSKKAKQKRDEEPPL